MKHTLSILLQNEAGALARVAGLFAARQVNIDTLTVAPTHDPAVSHLILVLRGSDATLQQIVRQTRKLVDVLDVSSLSLGRTVERFAGGLQRWPGARRTPTMR